MVADGQKKGLCRKLLAMMATSRRRIFRFLTDIGICPTKQWLFRESRAGGDRLNRAITSHPTGPTLDRAEKKCETAGSDGENLWLFQGSSPSGTYCRHFFFVLSRVASGEPKKGLA